MLLAERLISHWSGDDHLQHAPLPSHDPNSTDATKAPSASEAAQVEFDVELGELEQAEGITGGTAVHLSRQEPAPDEKERAYPLTLGLVVHALADGFALGSAAVSPIDTGLSFVVFLALVVHKGTCAGVQCTAMSDNTALAPTALALTTSLLATSLPRAECRKHLAIFSASTPVGAIVVYCLLSLVRIKSESNWTGVALLISVRPSLSVAHTCSHCALGRVLPVRCDRPPTREGRRRRHFRKDPPLIPDQRDVPPARDKCAVLAHTLKQMWYASCARHLSPSSLSGCYIPFLLIPHVPDRSAVIHVNAGLVLLHPSMCWRRVMGMYRHKYQLTLLSFTVPLSS